MIPVYVVSETPTYGASSRPAAISRTSTLPAAMKVRAAPTGHERVRSPGSVAMRGMVIEEPDMAGQRWAAARRRRARPLIRHATLGEPWQASDPAETWSPSSWSVPSCWRAARQRRPLSRPRPRSRRAASLRRPGSSSNVPRPRLRHDRDRLQVGHDQDRCGVRPGCLGRDRDGKEARSQLDGRLQRDRRGRPSSTARRAKRSPATGPGSTSRRTAPTRGWSATSSASRQTPCTSWRPIRRKSQVYGCPVCATLRGAPGANSDGLSLG